MRLEVPHWTEVRCQTAGCGATQVAKVRWVAGQGQIEVEWRCRKCHQMNTQRISRE